MSLRAIVMTAIVFGLLAGCTTPHPDLKSPCVGNEGSPCGPRHGVNDWWLNSDDQS